MQHINANDFFTPTPFNKDTKTQLWMSLIADSHDNICNCWHPFAHLLASIFPPGHKDRDLTINQILQRDLLEKQCHSGGTAAESPGGADGGDAGPPENIKREDQEENSQDEDIEELLAVAAAAEEQGR